MLAESMHTLSALQFPNFDGFIRTSRHETVAIGRKGYAQDPGGVPGHGPNQISVLAK